MKLALGFVGAQRLLQGAPPCPESLGYGGLGFDGRLGWLILRVPQDERG
jgi:hypothetical protein